MMGMPLFLYFLPAPGFGTSAIRLYMYIAYIQYMFPKPAANMSHDNIKRLFYHSSTYNSVETPI